MRVAVTGATGHIGANVVRDLLANGFQVRALCDPNDSHAALAGLDVETAQADVLRPADLAPALQGVDAVIHIAGIVSITGDLEGRVMKTNVEGVRNVARACQQTGVSRLVHVSSIHAFAALPGTQRLDETARSAGRTCFAYGRSKSAGERELLAAVGDGLNAVILNPTGVLGPHDHSNSHGGQLLRDHFRGRIPALVNAGFDWVDARDVAAAIRAALHSGRSGERYILSGRWASSKEIADLCELVSGTPAPRLILPVWFALSGLPFLRLLARIMGSRPLYTYESLLILRDSNKNCSSEKACRELGFRARPLRDTIRDTYQWNLQNGFIQASHGPNWFLKRGWRLNRPGTAEAREPDWDK